MQPVVCGWMCAARPRRVGSAPLAAFSLGGWFGWLAVAARRTLPASQSLLLLLVVLLPLPPLLLLLLVCIYLSAAAACVCVCDDDVAAVVLYAPGYT